MSASRSLAAAGACCCLVLLAAAIATCANSQPESRSNVGVTPSYSDSIKWSFGGWAPLDGPPPPPPATNKTGAAKKSASKAAPSEMVRTNKTRSTSSATGADAMSEAASVAMEMRQVQHHSHAARALAPYQTEHSNNKDLKMAANRMQHKYAMESMEAPPNFSPPAPVPIVREHLLAASAPNQQQARQPAHKSPELHHQHQHHHHHHHHHHHPQAQQQHQMQMQPNYAHQRPMMQPSDAHRQAMMQHHHQQQQQQRHRQHMMQHQHMMMRHHHRAPSRHHTGGAHQSMAPFAAQPHHPQHKFLLPPNSAPAGGGGGQSNVLYSHSLGAEMVPTLMELKGKDGAHLNIGHNNMTQASNYMPSAARAIEKDNLNYHQALQQVSNSLLEEHQRQQQQQQRQPIQQAPSNNIQDIKQRQNGHRSMPNSAANSNSKYLTIPVAVETEGDKVLTADDINEIEKQVINVLPNLKTADKIVKMTDGQLNLEQLERPQPVQLSEFAGVSSGHDELVNQVIGSLESDLHSAHGANQSSQLYSSTLAAANQLTGSSTPAMKQMSSPFANDNSIGLVNHNDGAATNSAASNYSESSPEAKEEQQQYFMATGPMQEVGVIDAEQMADYNLIKNDLLSGLQYEPTRSANGQSKHTSHQFASTPPMAQLEAGGHSKQPRPPTDTRYFHLGRTQQQQQQHQQQQQQQPSSYFGRINRPTTSQQPNSEQNYQNYRSSPATQQQTTRTILGGRKVSDVMRNLIHTTPVPMTTPMHVTSVEPEKVDAIQLIAGQANDKSPLVVEAHQLVGHTPDGGIDYGNARQSTTTGAYNQTQSPISYDVAGANSYGPSTVADDQTSAARPEAGGAVIEYVAMGGQQQQQQQQPASGDNQTPNYEQPPPALTWSPSVADEHQQHQLELTGHAAQLQQADMPATAGYNFFGAQSEQPQQQQQQQPTTQNWRTKAGGSQPNPDAQYDGQIAKGPEEPETNSDEEQNSSAAYGRAQDEQRESGDQQQYSTAATVDGNNNYDQQTTTSQNSATTNSADIQQQQQQQHAGADYGTRATPPGDEQQHYSNEQPNFTSGFVGGAQMNHPTQEPNYANYAKLDHENQRQHLEDQLQRQQQQQQSDYQQQTQTSGSSQAPEQQAGYLVEQVPARPSVQSGPESASSMIDDSPHYVQHMQPAQVADQQNLLNEETPPSGSADDHYTSASKILNGHRPSANVYQVYQAYYAPKDHKPLPGYVRLSLEEFNELFRDAEIQYVDKNLKAHVSESLPAELEGAQVAAAAAAAAAGQENKNYDGEQMRASASEPSGLQSILVDRRSIERRSDDHNQNQANTSPAGGQQQATIRKIISVRGAREAPTRANGAKVIKRTKSSETTTTTKSTADGAKPKKKTADEQRKSTPPMKMIPSTTSAPTLRVGDKKTTLKKKTLTHSQSGGAAGQSELAAAAAAKKAKERKSAQKKIEVAAPKQQANQTSSQTTTTNKRL